MRTTSSRPTLTRATRAFVPLLFGAALLVGCGDDGDSGDSTNTTEATADSQAAIDQVNGICTRFNDKFDELATDETELLTLADKAVDMYDEVIDDLSAVEASGDTADTLDKMVKSLEDARDDMKKAVESGDEDEVQQAGEDIDSRNPELDDEVAAAGFTECNDDSSDDDATTTTTTDEAASGDGLAHTDLVDQLTAPTGYELQSVDEATISTLKDAFEAEPSVVEIADEFGTATVVEGETPQGLLIFVGLKETPDDTTRQALLEGIIGTGTDSETVTIAGIEGVKYTDASGNITFVTIRNDTILMAISDDDAALEAIVSGLFEQNPDL